MVKLEELAFMTIEDLFSICINGMEYGINKRVFVGKNYGEFDQEYIKHILKSKYSDKNVYNYIGENCFKEVFDNINLICEEYLKIIYSFESGEDYASKSLNNSEVSFCKKEFPKIYDNVKQSLNNVK